MPDRIIELLIVPYGVASQVAPGRWERIATGAMIPEARVALMNEHRQVVGVARSFRQAPDGLYGEFYVSQTPGGDDALQLAADGAYGVSPGFIPEVVAEVSATMTEVRRASLRETTLTGTPAYIAGGVLSVRNYTAGGTVSEHTPAPPAHDPAPPAHDPAPPAPPAHDPAPPAPPVAAAGVEQRNVDLLARLDQLEQRMRAADPAPPTPVVTGTARGMRFRSFGHLVSTVAAYDRGDTDEAATAGDALGAMLEQRTVRRERSGATIVELRAFTNVGAIADSATPDGYVPELLELIRQGRVFANFMTSRNLDEVPGSNVQLPKIDQGAVVDYVGEAPSPAGQEVTQSLQSYPKATLLGGQGVTVQARDWSSPSYMDTVVRDHLAAYGDKLNLEAIAGNGAAGPPAHHSGAVTVVPAGNTEAAGTPPADFAEITAAIALVKAAVFNAVKRWPGIAFANADTWAYMEGLTDSDGRPFLVDAGVATNAPGTMSGASPVGKVRGLVGYAEDGVPAGSLLIPIMGWSELWESQASPASVQLMYPDALTIDVSVFGYSAVAHRRPSAFGLVTGIAAA